MKTRKSPIKRYARKCAVTDQGMNEGICYQDGLMYFADEYIYIRWIKENQPQWADGVSDEWLLNDSYEQGMHYYTEWEDETEYLYEMVGGELVEIND